MVFPFLIRLTFLYEPYLFGPPAEYNAFRIEENPEIVYVPGALTLPTIFTTIDLAFFKL